MLVSTLPHDVKEDVRNSDVQTVTADPRSLLKELGQGHMLKDELIPRM